MFLSNNWLLERERKWNTCGGHSLVVELEMTTILDIFLIYDLSNEYRFKSKSKQTNSRCGDVEVVYVTDSTGDTKWALGQVFVIDRAANN